MAQLHNQLFRGIWSEAVKKLLGVTKSPGGVERFGETLEIMLDLWSRFEFSWVREERLAWHQRTDALDAANISHVGIRNPSNSGQLLLIEDVTITTSSQDIQLFLDGNTEIADGSSSGFPRDLRINTPPQQTNIVGLMIDRTRATLPPAAIGPVYILNSGAAGIGPVILEAVLPPGTTLWFTSQAVNQALSVSARWRERAALPGELPNMK